MPIPCCCKTCAELMDCLGISEPGPIPFDWTVTVGGIIVPEFGCDACALFNGTTIISNPTFSSTPFGGDGLYLCEIFGSSGVEQCTGYPPGEFAELQARFTHYDAPPPGAPRDKLRISFHHPGGSAFLDKVIDNILCPPKTYSGFTLPSVPPDFPCDHQFATATLELS